MYLRRETLPSGAVRSYEVYEDYGELRELIAQRGSFRGDRAVGIGMERGNISVTLRCASDGREYRFVFENVEDCFLRYDARYTSVFRVTLVRTARGVDFTVEDVGITVRAEIVRAETPCAD